MYLSYVPSGQILRQSVTVSDGLGPLPGSDLFKPYQYVRESNCLTNFLDHNCFATQNLVGDKNQIAAKITKPLPAEIIKPQPCVEKNQF